LKIFAEHLALIANQIALQQPSGDPPMIKGAKDYVASHQSDPIKLEEIARALNVSTFHFCRKFKHATGLTFVEYLSRVRIEKAKILLHNKNLRITEIAYEVGFQSLTHFNRIFRKLVGHSPTEYRSTVIETHLGKHSSSIACSFRVTLPCCDFARFSWRHRGIGDSSRHSCRSSKKSKEKVNFRGARAFESSQDAHC
jgi:AraC-like DNA-binding protein